MELEGSQWEGMGSGVWEGGEEEAVRNWQTLSFLCAVCEEGVRVLPSHASAQPGQRGKVLATPHGPDIWLRTIERNRRLTSARLRLSLEWLEWAGLD